MSRPLEELSQGLGYSFSERGLLQAALTHRSAGGSNNERLEFLGDAVLGFVIAEWLYHVFPDCDEGDLSRLRANLVKKESLAEVARALSLGDFLQMGPGELRSGGFRRESILADAMEAVLGAVVLDSGVDECRRLVRQLFEPRFRALPAIDELKDPKTRLQEYLQSRKLELPRYRVLQVSGKSHHQRFIVECRADSVQRIARGEGRSRRIAEQAAAGQMLSDLSEND